MQRSMRSFRGDDPDDHTSIPASIEATAACSAAGGSRTRTGQALDLVPLPVGPPRRTPGWSRTITVPGLSRVPLPVGPRGRAGPGPCAAAGCRARSWRSTVGPWPVREDQARAVERRRSSAASSRRVLDMARPYGALPGARNGFAVVTFLAARLPRCTPSPLHAFAAARLRCGTPSPRHAFLCGTPLLRHTFPWRPRSPVSLLAGDPSCAFPWSAPHRSGRSLPRRRPVEPRHPPVQAGDPPPQRVGHDVRPERLDVRPERRVVRREQPDQLVRGALPHRRRR